MPFLVQREFCLSPETGVYFFQGGLKNVGPWSKTQSFLAVHQRYNTFYVMLPIWTKMTGNKKWRRKMMGKHDRNFRFLMGWWWESLASWEIAVMYVIQISRQNRNSKLQKKVKMGFWVSLLWFHYKTDPNLTICHVPDFFLHLEFDYAWTCPPPKGPR